MGTRARAQKMMTELIASLDSRGDEGFDVELLKARVMEARRIMALGIAVDDANKGTK